MPLKENKKCRQSCLTNAPAGISYKMIIGQTIYYKSFELNIPDVLVCFESFKTTDALAVDCDIAESYSVNASFFRISCHYRRIQFEETSFVGNIFKRDVADATSRHTIVLFVEKNVEIVIQVNGKKRQHLVVAKDASKDEIQELAMNDERVKAELEGKTVRKVVVVPGKLVNIVAN